MNRDELQRVRDWADQELTMGAEPPWRWHQYMKLREAADAILLGMDSTRPVTGPVGSQEGNSVGESVTFDWSIIVCQMALNPIQKRTGTSAHVT